MIAWLSWLLGPKAEVVPPSPREDLGALKRRRRALLDSRSSFLAYGFDAIADEDERTLKTLDRKILALRLRRRPEGGGPLNP